MNTLQASTTLPLSASNNIAKTPKGVVADDMLKADNPVVRNDRYSASSANDAVVAKVLSMSINKSVDQSVRSESAASSDTLSERFEASKAQNDGLFSIETVTNNVVNFVGKALSNMASKGFDSEQLSYFRDQAIVGVEVGIDQAKLELDGIADDTLLATIDETKDSIIGGINNLPVNPSEYSATVEEMKTGPRGTQNSFSTVELTTKNNDSVKLDFESLAFGASRETSGNREIYTSNASNISFSVQGDVNVNQSNQIASLVNNIDSVANSFYRGDIEAKYKQSKEMGYSDNELIGMAKQLQQSDGAQSTMTYGEIQHMNSQDNTGSNNSAPKAVADYLNKYLDVLESSKSVVSDERDFNELINGIVNQMKDVQVPDLLQAINRFHAFNKKFT